MRFRSLVMLCAAALIAVVARGCYAPDQPNCTYRCDTSADNNGHCPWDYECRADGYCHRKGTQGACSFVMPADLSAVPDMSAPPDQAMAADQAMGPDMSMPDLVTPGDI